MKFVGSLLITSILLMTALWEVRKKQAKRKKLLGASKGKFGMRDHDVVFLFFRLISSWNVVTVLCGGFVRDMQWENRLSWGKGKRVLDFPSKRNLWPNQLSRRLLVDSETTVAGWEQGGQLPPVKMLITRSVDNYPLVDSKYRFRVYAPVEQAGNSF